MGLSQWTTRIIMVCTVITLAACGDDPGEPPAAPPAGEDPGFIPVQDYASRGPYRTTSSTGGPDCTLFRPADPGADGITHPVLVWGNGTFATPGHYRDGLDHWASHGFVVVAADSSFPGSGDEMLDCLSWVLDQNTRSGPLRGAIATHRVGTSGHSQGGGGAVTVGADPRVSTSAPMAPWNGFSDRSKWSQQTGPMFINTLENDGVASASGHSRPIFDAINTPVFWGIIAGKGHNEAQPDFGAHRGPTTAWFRWQLMGDKAAGDLFVGDDCDLCKTRSGWLNIRKKGID